jgi:mutator protein MutT
MNFHPTFLHSAVYLILENEKKQILFSKRYNTGYADGYFSLPAGHIEISETPTQALIREVKEEIGLALLAPQLQLQHILYRKDNVQYIDFFFQTKIKQPEIINCEPKKCSQLIWCPDAIFPEPTIDYIRHTFKHIKRGELYSQYGFAI